MSVFKEISDGGENPNTPTVAQMRESQRLGSIGKGTSAEDYADKMACQNLGTGEGEGKDKEDFSESADYKEY